MKRYLKIACPLFLVAFLLFFVSSLALWGYDSYMAKASARNLLAGLQSKLEYVKEQGDAIAGLDELKKDLAQKDSFAILSLLDQEKDRHRVASLALTDRSGFLIVRTLGVNGRGTNVFLESASGRAVALGSSTASFEMNIFNPRDVYLITTRPVIDGGRMIGALFASENIDDAYATDLRDRFLSSGTELAFYGKKEGIHSSTFGDDGLANLVRLYFDAHSDWIARGHSGDIIRVPGGVFYRVINVPLPGVEGLDTGALIFVPVRPYIPQINLAFFTAAVLISLLMRRCLKVKERGRLKRLVYAASIAGLFAFIVILVAGIQIDKIPLMEKPSFSIYNSTLSLRPESGLVESNVRQSIDLIVNKGEEEVNAVDVTLTYDPAEAEVDEIRTDSSFCDHFWEKTIDQERGEVHVACGKPSPGLLTESGVIASVMVYPKKSFSLRFSPESQVLANDGLGTNVLRVSNGARFNLGPAASSSDPFFISLYSSSHPNGERWYNRRAADFNWLAIPGATYRYSLDASSTAQSFASTTGLATAQSHVSVNVPSDGIYYFHVAALEGDRVGPVATQRVLVDTVPPQDVSLKLSESEVKSGETVRLQFYGSDAQSGLLPNYYVRVNEGSFLLPVGNELYVPFTREGQNVITVRVFDRAGNYSEASSTVFVRE
jgi:Double sensory domain of two-component sensor kinase